MQGLGFRIWEHGSAAGRSQEFVSTHSAGLHKKSGSTSSSKQDLLALMVVARRRKARRRSCKHELVKPQLRDVCCVKCPKIPNPKP